MIIWKSRQVVIIAIAAVTAVVGLVLVVVVFFLMNARQLSSTRPLAWWQGPEEVLGEEGFARPSRPWALADRTDGVFRSW